MGIVQSDIIIREAARAAIREMRQNPNLIDDMLAELRDDPLSSGKYGDLTIQQCKDWFTGTKINVKLGLQVVQADLPAVAIALGAAPEGETTLGDVDWDETSDIDPADPLSRRQRRGVTASETYTLGCFAHGEPEHCLFLYSVLLFGLMRVKDPYLDQRGFMVSTFTVGPLTQAPADMEQVYVRTVSLTGKVRHTWPISNAPNAGRVIETVDTNLPTNAVVEPPGQAPKTIRSSVATDLVALMDQDMLSGVR
jgi:hypothetical protein